MNLHSVLFQICKYHYFEMFTIARDLNTLNSAQSVCKQRVSNFKCQNIYLSPNFETLLQPKSKNKTLSILNPMLEMQKKLVKISLNSDQFSFLVLNWNQ